jgi:uncharacterized protein (UPF0276 family)
VDFGPGYFARVRHYGVGLGINPSDLHTSYLDSPGTIGFFEVTAAAVRHRGPRSYTELWQRQRLAPGFEYRTIDDLAGVVPTLVHSTNVNPVYPQPVPAEDLKALRRLREIANAPWVTEDLGVWLMSERHVYPYFMQFPLDESALRVTIDNVLRVQDELGVPFNAEFPPMSLTFGTMHAFDFFRRLTEETGCGMCVDVGHVLSYQIARAAAPTSDFHLLPWESITEIHVAGGGIDLDEMGYRYQDVHGDTAIISVCLDLMDTVVTHAPNLKAIAIELFGARQPSLAFAKLRQVRERPVVAAWLAGDPPRPAPAPTLTEARNRTRAAIVAAHDLLHRSVPVSGAALAGAGADFLDGYAPADRRRWDYEREARLRLHGTTVSLYFPLTSRWIMRRRGMAEPAFHGEIVTRLDGWSTPMWEKVNAAFEQVIAADPDDLIGAELLRCERWMNECVDGSAATQTMEFSVDVAHVLENFHHACLSEKLVMAHRVTLRHVGEGRFGRQGARHGDEVHIPQVDASTDAEFGTAPCCAGDRSTAEQ